jgi:ribosome recycling factor
MPTIIDQHAPAFEQAVTHFENELQGLRTGRAHAGLVEEVKVEAYGSQMDLKGVASVSVPDAKTIQIEPWDKALVSTVEKALIIADLGIQPVTSGTIIRLVLPPMTEENRKHIVKQVHEKAEETRIAIRTVREEVREAIQKMEKEKQIGEDEKFRLQEQLEKTVKDWNERIEQIASKKETEIMTI